MAKAQNQGKARLLDHWRMPATTSKPIGCLATTFTFAADFFEEECLSRFLGMETNAAEDGPIYLVEREERLNGVSCASVLVDQAYSKQVRNLRWDLIPFRLNQGILHAKISVLYWSGHLRLLVGSANLTENGYRKNQELMAVLDLAGEEFQSKQTVQFIVQELISWLKNDRQASSSVNNRSIQFLESALEFASSFPDPIINLRKSPFLSFPILVQPGGKTLLQQVSEIWQEEVGNVGPSEAYIISPFFDPPSAEYQPAKQLWDIIRKKGPAKVFIQTTGEWTIDNIPARIHAPIALKNSCPTGRKEASIQFNLINTEIAEENANRPLHAKAYWFSNGEIDFYLVGSSNFTARGLGISSRPNIEANIGILTDFKRYPELNAILEASWLKGEPIEPDQVQWEPVEDEEMEDAENTPALPSFFQTATIKRNPELVLELHFLPGDAVPDFQISSNKEERLLTHQQWVEQLSPSLHNIPIQDINLPSYLLITWKDHPIPAYMPINIEDHQCLPPPEDLRNLPLDVLAELITSAKPLFAILKKYLLKKSEAESMNGVSMDPLKKYDSSSFLLQRTRKYSLAINKIQTTLETPFITLSSLEWKLYGPVGIQAIIEAMARESKSNSEAVFFLTEIWEQLGDIQPKEEKGYLPLTIVLNEVSIFRERLKQQIQELWTASDNPEINRYSKKILEKEPN